MNKAIAVIGSGKMFDNKQAIEAAQELGKEIAKQGFVLVSGAGKGFPLEASRAAREAGGFTVGISPALDRKDHVENWKYAVEEFNSIVFTGFGRGRNVFVVRGGDAVILIGGQAGTLNEFSFAFDEGKPIGVLENTGGISNNIKEIIKAINKETGSKVVFSSSPKELVAKIKELV